MAMAGVIERTSKKPKLKAPAVSSRGLFVLAHEEDWGR
jgi:hypothetical protein